jgi:hypothetical protein
LMLAFCGGQVNHKIISEGCKMLWEIKCPL